MNERISKRKDSRGRVLNNGECQLSDGRYRFKYTDNTGKARSVFSYRLKPDDPMPLSRRRQGLSLRELENKITADLLDNITPDGGNLTVLDVVSKYANIRKSARSSTVRQYELLMTFLKKDSFGNLRIDKVKMSDCKEWFIRLKASGKGFSTLNGYKKMLKPAFKMAISDDLIRKNPFDFALTSVVDDDSKKREALTKDEEEQILTFIKNESSYAEYYDVVYILLNTGLRISEFCGITVSAFDWEENTISIEQQLLRTVKGQYYIEKLKTKAGRRVLPLTKGVREAFVRILDRRNAPAVEPIIDGKTGFLFYSNRNTPYVAEYWERVFRGICKEYFDLHKKHFPTFTPHVCRHTYCSRMIMLRINPKTLQYLMGHANIQTTLNIYGHVHSEDVREELKAIGVL